MLDVPVDTPLQATVELGQGNHHQCYGKSRQGWIVAHTHSQAERWADANLRRRGYRTYLPLHTVQRRDRVVPTMVRCVTVPLWPGYVFVWHSSTEPRRPIRETPGVRDVVRCGSQTPFVRDGAVEALRSALQAGERGWWQRHQQGPVWAPGASCVVAKGIFAGHGGVILSVAEEMALVSVLFLGELRELALSLDSIAAREAA